MNVPKVARFVKGNNYSSMISAVIFFIIIFSLTGCGQRRVETIDGELERNRQLWRQKKIPDYNFVVYRITMGTWGWQPNLIQVRNGNVFSKEAIGEVGPMMHVDGHEQFETVEKMFATIEDAYKKGYDVNIIYNRECGYPEQIRIDKDPGGTDQAIITYIKEFEIVNG